MKCVCKQPHVEILRVCLFFERLNNGFSAISRNFGALEYVDFKGNTVAQHSSTSICKMRCQVASVTGRGFSRHVRHVLVDCTILYVRLSFKSVSYCQQRLQFIWGTTLTSNRMYFNVCYHYFGATPK